MQALVRCHLHHNKMTAETLFRAAYQHRFEKDIPHDSLTRDIEQYERFGRIPPYVTDMMVEAYGAA